MLSAPVCGIVLGVLGAGWHWQPAPIQSPISASLRIEQAAISPEGFLEVTVRNVGNRTITAWATRSTIRYADGMSEQLGFSADGFISGFSAEAPPYRYDVFRPGRVLKRRVPTRLRDVPVAQILPIPVALIFDNAAAVGDSVAIQDIFENRRQEWQALEKLNGILTSSLTELVDPWIVLLDIFQQLEAVTDKETRRTVAYQQLTRNVSLAIGSKASDSQAIRTRLDNIRSRVSTHRARAQQHQRPR